MHRNERRNGSNFSLTFCHCQPSVSYGNLNFYFAFNQIVFIVRSNECTALMHTCGRVSHIDIETATKGRKGDKGWFLLTICAFTRNENLFACTHRPQDFPFFSSSPLEKMNYFFVTFLIDEKNDPPLQRLIATSVQETIKWLFWLKKRRKKNRKWKSHFMQWRLHLCPFNINILFWWCSWTTRVGELFNFRCQ